MADLTIAQVGCGGMGLRHLYGEVELQRRADSFDVVAVCDLNRSAAEHVANEAEKGLGRRPAVYTDFQDLLDSEKDLDAVDIVTDVGLHHRLAFMAFEAGVNVAVEKPMGVTVRACLRMMEAAERAGKVLLVEENHRRDPVNRLVKAILDSGALGGTRLMHVASLGGTRSLPHGTAWRHIKNRGGFLLDYGVHDTDLFLYFLGEIESVFAETRLWEPVRQTAQHHAAEPESWGAGGLLRAPRQGGGGARRDTGVHVRGHVTGAGAVQVGRHRLLRQVDRGAGTAPRHGRHLLRRRVDPASGQPLRAADASYADGGDGAHVRRGGAGARARLRGRRPDGGVLRRQAADRFLRVPRPRHRPQVHRDGVEGAGGLDRARPPAGDGRPGGTGRGSAMLRLSRVGALRAADALSRTWRETRSTATSAR